MASSTSSHTRNVGWTPRPSGSSEQARTDGASILRVNDFLPLAFLSEMFEASRVPSGHGFPAVTKNPQPDGMRLAKLSAWATRGISAWRTAPEIATAGKVVQTQAIDSHDSAVLWFA